MDDDVRRRFENLKAKSNLTATVILRNPQYYCELTNMTPMPKLKEARENEQSLCFFP